MRIIVWLALTCLVCGHAWAESEYEVPKVVAVQKRPYFLNNEMTAQIGYLPMDSFTKYFAVGASYTHYFSDFVGWEIVNADYAANISTGLVNYLSTLNASTEKFDVLNYYATTNIVFTPFYGKNLVFDTSILYSDFSIVAGMGISKFETAGNVNTFDVGLVMRYVLGPKVSLKFDFRDYLYLSGDTKNNLMLIAGLAFNFGSKDEPAVVSGADE